MNQESSVNQQEWDDFILANHGSFLQSWNWAEFQEALGRPVYRLAVKDAAGATISQFTEVFHELPLRMWYAYVPRGPVVKIDDGPEPAAGRERLDSALGALRASLRQNAAVFARVELPFEQANDLIEPDELQQRGFKSVKPTQPADTSIIDLAPSAEALLAAMHHKTRYNIRLAERRGLAVRTAAADGHAASHDLDLFWQMLSETAVRDVFHTHPKRYYLALHSVLGPKETGLRVRLLFAEHQGRPVAAGLFGYFGDTVTYLHGASIEAYRQLMGPQMLHWTVMRQAQAEGYRAYDLWGIAPTDDSDHPWAGITRFKKGFGGETVRYLGAWELPNYRLLYKLYRYAKRFRNT